MLTTLMPTPAEGLLACADILLHNLVEHDRKHVFVELARMSRVCRDMRLKVTSHMTMVRSLSFPREQLWQSARADRLDAVLASVRRTASLRALDLSALGALSEEECGFLIWGLASAGHIKTIQIRDLTLPKIAMCEAAMALISTMGGMVRLDLSRIRLADTDAAPLARMLEGLQNLNTISCGDEYALGWTAFGVIGRALAGMHNLQEVNLCRCDMSSTEGGCGALFSGLTGLQVLRLTENRNALHHVGSAQVFGECISRMHSLHTLSLVNNIRQAPEEYVQAPEALWRGFTATLAARHELRRLSIRGTGYSEQGCTFLALALDWMVHLEELDMSRNNIGAAGMQRLVDSLRRKPLKIFNLAENNLEERGCQSLVPVFTGMTSLQMLDLAHNGIGAACRELVAFLPTSLVALRLGNNEIDCRGVVDIGNAMRNLRALEELELDNNEIADDGIREFSQMVGEAAARGSGCRKLLSLNLIANKISSRGCSALVHGLVELPRIRRLLLGENLICAEGCMEVSAVLRKLTALQELDLGCNRIDKDACEALASIGRRRSGLRINLDAQVAVARRGVLD